MATLAPTLHKEILLPGGETDADHQFDGPIEYAEVEGSTLETEHRAYAELVPKEKCMLARFPLTYYTRPPKSTGYTGRTLNQADHSATFPIASG